LKQGSCKYNPLPLSTGKLNSPFSNFGLISFWEFLYTDYVEIEITYNPYKDNTFKVNFTGENSDDTFGWSVNASGDVTGDGFSDAVVGAPGYKNDQGRAYVFFGNDSLYSELSIPAKNADVILTLGSPGDKFGHSVGSADFGTDGYSDILVGAPYNDTYDGSKINIGAVYVFNGSKFIPKFISDSNYTRAGEYAQDHFGWSVANAFNFNNVSYNELIVGAPHFDNNTIRDVGKAYVLTTIPEYPIWAVPIIFLILFLFTWKLYLRYNKRKK